MMETNRSTYNQVISQTSGIETEINKWKGGLKSILSMIDINANAYKISCEKLDIMEGTNKDNRNIEWNDIEQALLLVKINANYIDVLKKSWEALKDTSDQEYKDVYSALTAIRQRTIDEENKNKNALAVFWSKEEQNQKMNEADFLKEVDAYMTGTGSIEKLKAAAEKVYGKNAPSMKSHFNLMHNVMLNDLSLYLNINTNLNPIFSILGEEITLLTLDALENRYNAELSAREIEWELILKGIEGKSKEWETSALLILENGRNDWIISQKKMKDAHNQWLINFQNEYNRVNNEWNEAYLAGLEDKERWLAQAADAANNASSEAFLSLVGAEGERLSRFMDVRDPSGIRDAIPETQTLMNELLQSSGIVNMSKAFVSLNGIADTVSVITRSGLGGISIWDTALVKTAASDVARKANSDIADNETKKLAYTTRLEAEQAIKYLIANVDNANQNFSESMDEHFIFQGFWRKIGNNYVKDVLKGSTLFLNYILETATINGYIYYAMEPITLQTNLDENYLVTLNTIAIRGLLTNAINEIKTISDEIFGKSEKSTEENQPSPGKFDIHIGHAPEIKPPYDMGESKESMFYHLGTGEQGRLMSEYIYWLIIEERGKAELAMAPWDKRMWNDDGSWFKAISLRTAGTIACSIAAGVVTGGAGFAGIALAVGIGSASEVLFSSLDVAGGYKTLDEAAFNVGKTVLTSTLSGLGGGLFNGIASSSGGVLFEGLTAKAASLFKNDFLKVGAQAVMAGAQTATISLAASSISGITYSSDGGWGYNSDIFKAGMENFWSGTLTAMTSTLVSTSLHAVNKGLDMNKMKGFNKLNIDDLGKLNNLAGSLAGQGMNYAFGNDFTLNVLNMGLLTGGNVNGGLLELNLGRNGTTMNFGTGGANVSLENLSASIRGVMVWNVNSRIGSFVKNESNKFDSAIALRAQYGYGDYEQKNQLQDILKGNVLINTEAEGDFRAKSTINADGKKVVNLTGYERGMSDEQQFLLAVILGHEAYRDGIVTDDNYIETRSAVIGHTQMALKMLFAGENIAFDSNLNRDMAEYMAAFAAKDGNLFNAYVDGNYDSTADYWKLVFDANNNAMFEWDGKYTFDLSVIGLGEVDELSEEAFSLIANRSNGNFDINNFKSGLGAFYNLNSIAIDLEGALSSDNEVKKAAVTATIQNQIINFTDALKGVDSSGLLMRNTADIRNLGSYPQIFADGGGIISCGYGIRAVNWVKNVFFQRHFAWDLIPTENWKLVAPMNGVLKLDFTKENGLNITTTNGNQSISYEHTSANSVKDYIKVFSSTGVTINNNGSLNGISKNMVIGTMGNTGTQTTGAHVHLTYYVNNIKRSPGSFFHIDECRDGFPMTSYAQLMSGFNNSPDINQVSLTNSDIRGIEKYLYSTYENPAVASDKFIQFGAKTDRERTFHLINGLRHSSRQISRVPL